MVVPKAIGSDVPNFVKDAPNFVKNVPRVPKCVSKWELTTNHFFMGFQMKLWPLSDRMGVSKAVGWDVPNFINDVPNFVKDVPYFVKDVPRVPKCVSRWGSATNHFFMDYQMKLWPLGDKMGVL